MHKLAMIPTMYMTLRLPGIIPMQERIFIIVLYKLYFIFSVKVAAWLAVAKQLYIIEKVQQTFVKQTYTH